MSCSRSLLDLHPAAALRVNDWIELCGKAAVDILIYCTLRDRETQANLYRQGASIAKIEAEIRHLVMLGMEEEASILKASKVAPLSGRKVTNAAPGLSYHQPQTVAGKTGSLACDFVPLLGGKPAWTQDGLYLRAGELAEKAGLTWSGRWEGSMKETAHVQFDDGGRLKMPDVAQGKFA